MTEIFKHVRGLKFEEKPNYEFIKVKIREALLNLGFENDYIFDWSETKPKEDLDRVKKTSSIMRGSKSTSKYTLNINSTPKLKVSRYERSEERK